jgi:hypothetical protein
MTYTAKKRRESEGSGRQFRAESCGNFKANRSAVLLRISFFVPSLDLVIFLDQLVDVNDRPL